MLIKEENERSCSRRINFIDKNDAFVGFDYSSCCCEDFGYYITDVVTAVYPDDDLSLEGFWFDTSVEPMYAESGQDAWGDEDGALAFRCINENGAVRYLHLYNHHNGYYSHGWNTSWGQQGSL